MDETAKGRSAEGDRRCARKQESDIAVDARTIILKKKNGEELSSEELRHMIVGYTEGRIPDYQMSAWLMAVLWRGMTDKERHETTKLMLHSGRVIRPDRLPTPSVDKHSTGGVGDKVSLALAPLVASAGVYVPMLSGRSLGHTGGTLDKLESIEGLRTDLPVERFISTVKSVGACIASQTDDMVPADGKIYALRDVTGTVESIPLIVASIISKKVAEGAESFVFDVKWGRGAFMSEMDGAIELASKLVEEADRQGRRALAFVTDMNQPLGRAVGNALELAEAVELLRGGGPADAKALTLLLGAAMLNLAGKSDDLAEGVSALEETVRSGRALAAFKAMIEAQGGDTAFLEDVSLLAVACNVSDVCSPADGYVSSIDCRNLGFLVCDMGGGRTKTGQLIDHGVGAILLKKRGDEVGRGEPLMRLYLSDKTQTETLTDRAEKLFIISEAPPAPSSLVSWKVTTRGAERWSDTGLPDSVRCVV
jgi:pyrimidine-nucleoside phosphorylase